MSSKEGLSRRQFVSFSLTAGLGGSIVGRAVFGAPVPRNPGAQEEYDQSEYQWGFLVDTTLCIGCGSCVRACRAENKVPDGYYRTWVERFEMTKSEKLSVDSPNGALDGFHEDRITEAGEIMKAFFVPKLCNHCVASACTQVCPVGATFHSPDGVVLVDREYCMGCGYCIQACPYGCRFLNKELGVADKCTLCYHRLSRGLDTACVQACPVGARLSGNLRDEESEIRKKLRERRYGLLKPDLGTVPKCFYVGLDLMVI